MSNAELYYKVVEAYRSGDENYFTASVRNWLYNADEAPFENSKARDLFAKAKVCYAHWKNKAIDGRVSKIRMIAYATNIIEMELPNPYKTVEEIEAEKPVEEIHEEEHIKEPEEEIQHENNGTVGEPIHVLGVLPEEKPRMFHKRTKKRGSK